MRKGWKMINTAAALGCTLCDLKHANLDGGGQILRLGASLAAKGRSTKRSDISKPNTHVNFGIVFKRSHMLSLFVQNHWAVLVHAFAHSAINVVHIVT